MKRWIRRALTCLLFGAVMNLAVAWACALPRGPGRTLQSRFGPARPWLWEPPSHWGQADGATTSGSFGHRTESVYRLAKVYSLNPNDIPSGSPGDTVLLASGLEAMTIEKSGWPWLAFESRQLSPAKAAGATRPAADFHIGWPQGITIPRSATTFWAVLPVVPIWPGWLLGTLLYGTAVAGVWSCGALVRMAIDDRRRRREGLCAHCAYPIGTSPVCTECGRPVKPGAGARA